MSSCTLQGTARHRMAAAPAAALAVAVLLAGCSGGDDGAAERPGTDASAEAGTEASAGTAGEPDASGSPAPQDGAVVERIVAAAEATFAGSSRVDASQVVAGQSVSSSTGAYDYAQQIGTVTTSAGGQELAVVLTTDTAYVGLEDGGATGYVSFPLDGSSAFGSFIAESQSPEAQQASLQAFAGATDVTERGSEPVKAGEATAYTGNLSVEDLTAASGAAGQAFQELVPPDTLVPFVIWIDGEDRVVRTELVVEVPGTGAATTTVDYYDFGLAVEAVPPAPEALLPEAQAAEVRALFDQQLSQLQPGG